MLMSSATRGFLFAVIGAVGFSFKAILAKLMYGYGLDASAVMTLRMGYALPFFILMGVIAQRRAKTPISQRDWGWLIVLAILGYYLASYFDFAGLQYISATLERLILFLYPTIVLIIGAIWLKKPITRLHVIALLVSYIGIALALFSDFKTHNSHNVWLGGSLVFASALSYAFYLVINGMIVERVGAARLSAWATSIACIIALCHYAITHSLSTMLTYSPLIHAYGLAMAIFTTLIPIWCISAALIHIGTARVALCGALGPVFTLFLGWLILHEPVTGLQMLGGSLAIVGVMIAQAHRQ